MSIDEQELEDRLRRTLGAVADSTRVHPDWPGVEAAPVPLGSRRRPPRWLRPVVAAAALTLVVGAAIVLAGGDEGGQRVDTVSPAPTEPLRFVPGELPDGWRLVSASGGTEMGGGGSRGRLWVYSPVGVDTPVADRVVAVVVGENAGELSDLPLDQPTPTTIGTHTDATVAGEPDGGWIVSWTDDTGDGGVLVLGRGLSRDDLVAFAETVTLDGPTDPPEGFGPVYEGPEPSFEQRTGVEQTYETGDGRQLALIVMSWPTFDPTAYLWRPWGGGGARIVGVRGRDALLVDPSEGSSALVWKDRDGYVVNLSGDALDADQLVAFAEALREVGVADWESAVASVLEDGEDTATETTIAAPGGPTTTALGALDTWTVDGREVRAHRGDLDGEDVLCFQVDGVATEFCPAVSVARDVRSAQVPDDLNVLVGTADAEGAERWVEVELLDGRTFREELGPEVPDIRVRPWAIVLPEPFTGGSIRILDTGEQVVQGASVGG